MVQNEPNVIVTVLNFIQGEREGVTFCVKRGPC